MIFISAGHHPTKPGACYGSFCEFDEASKWADLIYELIGGDRCMRVPSGVLREKVAFINAREPTLAAEIHFNADGRQAGNGCLTLHYPGSIKGRMVAIEVQDGMEQIFRRHWNGVMEGYYRMDKSRGPDYFLAKTKCPSVIIEPEFIHNRDRITENREGACANIASSLLSVLRKLQQED